MKTKVLIFIISGIFILSFEQVHAQEGNLDLNPDNLTEQDNENSISTQYKGYDFFDKEDIAKSRKFSKQQNVKIKQQKNKLFEKKIKKEVKSYQNIEDLTFTTMFVYRENREEAKDTWMIYMMGLLFVWSLTAVVAIAYFKKKKQKGESVYDYNHNMLQQRNS